MTFQSEQLRDTARAEQLDQDLADERARIAAQRAADAAERARERAQWQAELQRAKIRDAVAIEAKAQGIVDEDDVDLPALKSALELVRMENGKVVGAEEAVAAIKKLKPAKFASAKAPESAESVEAQKRAAAAIDAGTLDEAAWQDLDVRLRRPSFDARAAREPFTFDLDSSLLSAGELEALGKVLRGLDDVGDRGILEAARVRTQGRKSAWPRHLARRPVLSSPGVARRFCDGRGFGGVHVQRPARAVRRI